MTDDLLALYLVDSVAARAAGQEILTQSPDPARLAQAHRVIGVCCRDAGEDRAALAHLRKALAHARRAGRDDVLADIGATWGSTLVYYGRHRPGLQALTDAVGRAEGVLLATTLYRKGVCLVMLGRDREAIPDLERAISILDDLNERVWLAHAFHALSEAQMQIGLPMAAADSLAMFSKIRGADLTGDEAIRVACVFARLAFMQGDLAGTLGQYAAIDIHAVTSVRLKVALCMEKAQAQLACGLYDVAVESISDVELSHVPTRDTAELMLVLAEALFASGHVERARDLARSQVKVLVRTGAELRAAEGSLVLLQAQVALGEVGGAEKRAVAVARQLSDLGSWRACDAWIVAARCATGATQRQWLAESAAFRTNDDRFVRGAGWYGRAWELDVLGRPGVLRSCRRGLDALDEYRDVVGSSELRASVTSRGRDLAALALRHAAHDPRALLTWSERWRATALAQAPVTPRGDVSPTLAMLRDSGRRIAEARAAGESTVGLERERRTLERKVRAEHHQQRADGRNQAKRFNAVELIDQVGGGAFVELVDVDGILHVLVVSKGRVRRVIAGETKAALDLAGAGRFALRRAARTNRYAPGDLGARFQAAVLGTAVRLLPDGPVTISPTAALHGAPFALMPALATRPFSIVPSAAQWMRARAVPTPRVKRRALVSGPGLVTGGAEVSRLAAVYPDATTLRDAEATVAATMRAIDGAKLAHLATHGTFRADSPLFSALELADGQLSVYELERLKQAPYRTILSACDSGVVAPVGAQEVLGLASALFSLGGAGLVCSIAEVNDEATAELMMHVHASLDAKRTPADALSEVRASGSPIEQATAAAFVALGV